MKKPTPRPFLKWAGGKTSSLDVILDNMPKKFNVYEERFLGAGAVFFALAREKRFKQAVLSDINSELITTFKAIRDSYDRVIDELKRFSREINSLDSAANCRSFYNTVRSIDPAFCSAYYVAARMIILNKTCFNGIYRTNKSGEFNSTWGKVEKFIPDIDNIRAVSEVLRGVEIRQSDEARSVVSNEDLRGHVIYLDPPYFPVSKTANFTAYNAAGFSIEDQYKTAAMFARLARQGATVLASNSDVPIARALYSEIPGVRVIETKVNRSINCDAKSRGKVGELLFVHDGKKKR